MSRTLAVACSLCACTAALTGRAAALGVRGDLRTTASYLDHRSVVRESIPESEVPGDGVVRVLSDGTIVYCIPGGDCYSYRAADTESSTPMAQELRVSAWSARARVSARAHVRSRLGADAFWPRSRERFLVVTAYSEIDRTAYRVRLGRQEMWGGLGPSRFDGASVAVSVIERVRLEAFAGRNLGRDFAAPGFSDLLRDADAFAPDEPSILWGLEARFDNRRGLAATGLYQRDERADGAGLYSERAALDARYSSRRATADLSLDWDAAISDLTETRLRIAANLARDLSLRLEGRRYRPSFDLWTIWTAFSPVAYVEEKAGVSWGLRPNLRVEIEGAYRNYDDTDTESEAFPIASNGWRLRTGARWNAERWSTSLAYRLHQGFGAFKSFVDASAGRRVGDRGYLGLFGNGGQQFAEFRTGEKVSWGGGVEARTAAGRIGAEARAAVYRHGFDNRPRFSDVTQLRGTVGVTLDFGDDPGEAFARGNAGEAR